MTLPVRLTGVLNNSISLEGDVIRTQLNTLGDVMASPALVSYDPGRFLVFTQSSVRFNSWTCIDLVG
jgi:hypothetical protein